MNLLELSENDKLAFFLNLYNAMVIHAVIRVGCPESLIDRRSFFNDFLYLVGGHPYSLTDIKNGVLRCNRRTPYSLLKPFSAGDRRLEVNRSYELLNLAEFICILDRKYDIIRECITGFVGVFKL